MFTHLIDIDVPLILERSNCNQIWIEVNFNQNNVAGLLPFGQRTSQIPDVPTSDGKKEVKYTTKMTKMAHFLQLCTGTHTR